MRVAILTETFLPDVNGVVTTLCRMLEHLRERGHEALVIGPQSAPSSYVNHRVVRLGGVPLPLYPELRLTLPQPGVVPTLRRFRPEIIYMAGLTTLGPTARFAAAQLGVPAVAVYHTDWPAYAAHYGLGLLREPTYAYLRWLHNGCAATLVPSSATLADLRAHGFRRLRVWGRGVDTERFHPRKRSAEWRAAVGAQPDERVLLYVGRLAFEKRVDLLCEAVADLPNTRLVLVGDGPARRELEQRYAGRPITFQGYLSGEALATAYASADLFVFPSDTDTFGQVIQEALASGLPVVAARAGGAVDLVREGVTGALFAPGSTADLRAALRRVSVDETLHAAGAAGRVAAEQRTWARLGDELLGHLERAMRSQLRVGGLRLASR